LDVYSFVNPLRQVSLHQASNLPIQLHGLVSGRRERLHQGLGQAQKSWF
jgi:hypothetical protein